MATEMEIGLQLLHGFSACSIYPEVLFTQWFNGEANNMKRNDIILNKLVKSTLIKISQLQPVKCSINLFTSEYLPNIRFAVLNG